MRTQRVKVSDIHVGARMRTAINPDTVRTIAASIKEIGLQNPISICFRDNIEIDGESFDGVGCLVAGAHRREALISLGTKYEYVDAVVFDDEVDARKWEISENLHRKDLTVDERSEHIAEWIRLTEDAQNEERAADKPGQVAPVYKGGRGNEGGINAASRELGIETTAAKRAVKIASRTPEAKEAARVAGLDNNQKALLEIARAEPEKQVEKVREIVERKAAPKTTKPESTPPVSAKPATIIEAMVGAKEAYFAKLDAMKVALHREWLSGPEDWQLEYLERPHPTGGQP